MIEDIEKRTLDDVRAAYKKYLNGQNLSKNTIMTSSTDAFYIWRKQGADSFWNIVFSDNFETLGKDTLLELLSQANINTTYLFYIIAYQRHNVCIQDVNYSSKSGYNGSSVNSSSDMTQSFSSAESVRLLSRFSSAAR